MIYPYIKVNPKVVAFLGLTGQREKLKLDGNSYLWKFDLLPLGGNNDETIRMIGGVGLQRSEVAAEQRREVYFELPVAEDERFRMEGQTLPAENEEAPTPAEEDPEENASEQEIPNDEQENNPEDKNDDNH